MASANVTKIRRLIQDKPLYIRETITLTSSVELNESPIAAGSIVFESSDYEGSFPPSNPVDGSLVHAEEGSDPSSNPDGSDPVLNVEGSDPDLPNYTVDYDNGVIFFNTTPFNGTAVLRYYTTILSDADIQACIDIEGVETDGADIRLAAADALDVIAANQALVLKVITNQGLATNGAALANALAAQADRWRKLVFSSEYQESTFDIIEEINDVAGFREKIIKDLMRSS